ncbi:hypothetical protein GPJ56_002002 [Histomonas meleagridis]|uniref:uncharacterized protein n=1 Tax=Histomonas meleagridis TaxID=135588 RepID=UPI0035599162|nr:hypothetical protein GPJ56_002002 [Histomonas meleagridis]KAH0800921.1 hypothetical protein GO595_006237 [Histomonas meleagridis]
MSNEESDLSNTSSKSFGEDEIKAVEEYEQVQNLEIKKKLLEIEIQRLENEMQTNRKECFSRDQLPTLKTEVERRCNESFAKRINSLLSKIEQAKSEKHALEQKAESLKKTLENEKRLTQQLIEEKSSQKAQFKPQFPEFIFPDLTLLKESKLLMYEKRALEDEIRDAEQQLSIKKQSIAENEANLVKIIHESKTATAECEKQIRQETLELAQLEEMKNSLRERIEANKQKQKTLEIEKRNLTLQIESAEASQRAKIDEINRNFLAAQREYDEMRSQKQEEIRKLTKQLHENEELNRIKLQEKEQLIREMNDRITPIKNTSKQPQKITKSQKNEPQIVSVNVLQMQNEIEELQQTKITLTNKLQELQRKASSNIKKLESIKKKLERKIEESKRQIMNLKLLNDTSKRKMDFSESSNTMLTSRSYSYYD